MGLQKPSPTWISQNQTNPRWISPIIINQTWIGSKKTVRRELVCMNWSQKPIAYWASCRPFIVFHDLRPPEVSSGLWRSSPEDPLTSGGRSSDFWRSPSEVPGGRPPTAASTPIKHWGSLPSPPIPSPRLPSPPLPSRPLPSPPPHFPSPSLRSRPLKSS